MSLDQHDLIVIAQGAASAAENYIGECLDIDLAKSAEGPVQVSDEQAAAMIICNAFTVVLLQIAAKVTIRNPDLRDQYAKITATVSDELAKKAIDKLTSGDMINPS